jgi:hypothetical protein
MNTITLSSARHRLRVALQLLDACEGIATDPGPTLEEQLRAPYPIDRPLSLYCEGLPLPDDHIVRQAPAVTVRAAIERAADEARHAAQEALDEIAHAAGWPR